MATAHWTVDSTGDRLQTEDETRVAQTRERMWLDAKHWARQGLEFARVKCERIAENSFVISGRGYQLRTNIREMPPHGALMHEKQMQEALLHTALALAAKSTWSSI